MAHKLVISDLQAPYEHPDALAFALEAQRFFDCDGEPYNVGDELDLHAFSSFVSDPDLYSPGHELAAAREHLEPWFTAFPKMRLCNSNHVNRLPNKVKRAGIPRECMRPIKEILGAPEGWEWRNFWVEGDVRIEHGHELFGKWSTPKTALQQAVTRNMQSTVFGHCHGVFGVQYTRTPRGRMFGAGSGCLIWDPSYAFDYAGSPSKKTSQLGLVVLLDGVPYPVPMRTDKHGRWVGEL